MEEGGCHGTRVMSWNRGVTWMPGCVIDAGVCHRCRGVSLM